MSLLSEFKEFAMKGNVVDLAVAVIIGAAFGKIVDSFVKDIVMPIIGQIVGGVDFSQLYINLGSTAYPTMAEAVKAGAPLIQYGVFINAVVNFVIIAFAIFMVIKAMTKFKKPEAPSAPAATPEDILLLREIRDTLKK